MTNEPQSLSKAYSEAETFRLKLDAFLNSNTPEFQESISSAIAKYQQCVAIAAEISLFSPNETIEDVSSRDLQYLLLHYRIGGLTFRRSSDAGDSGSHVGSSSREMVLDAGRLEMEKFLGTLDQYDLLSRADAKSLQRYKDDRNSFLVFEGGNTVTGTSDAARRRDAKIARFREEKALKYKLEQLRLRQSRRRKDTGAQYDERNDNDDDDDLIRQSNLAEISLATMDAFASLESAALETQMLAAAPSSHDELMTQQLELQRQRELQDSRARSKAQDGYSERLDPSINSLLAGAPGGPILSRDGRPIRPFTLLDSRQRLRAGVFRPDHNLPTMTIDEYLEEERKRGGIIDGGGEASMRKEVVDEDDMARADEETKKARHWDEFKEDNPRGAGNTMNMG